MKIGFIGLGIMGRPMALNLLKAGFELTVYNRTASKCETLREAGADVASSPAEAARGADAVITIVSNTCDVEEVLLGPQGVHQGIASGAVVIDMSTISPIATEQFARRFEELGVSMLDAPVSGGDTGAQAGTLSIMVGGPAEAFQRCLPVFQAMGKTITHIGPSGHGQKTKLVNQVLGAGTCMAMVDAVRLMQKSGLDCDKAIQALAGGAAGSWQWSNLAPRVVAEDFAPGFMIKLLSKDLRLVEELARSLNLELPIQQETAQCFFKAEASGLGDLGTQGVYRLFEKK
ncbi:NAD(P)-dependent oxidoreductase [Candidatus Sumerlaeota bacterium]|nr:NAD(P)-dependent oxidoreductase [Candidatus Sumerlaeota bacterium]